MEQFINELVFKLQGKLSSQQINDVRVVLYSTLKNYDVVPKVTEVAVIEDDLPQKAKIYLASRKIDGLSIKTLKQYERTLRRFFEVVKKNVEDVKTEDCRLFFYYIQQENGMENRALDTQRAYLNAFFAWLNDNDYIPKNPCSPIKPFKYEKKLKKELTDIEMEKLRQACKNEYELCIIEVLYSTGCRVSELVNIKLSDINGDEVEIVQGKGNKSRMTYLNAKALLAIEAYTKDRDYDSVYLFENFRKPHNQLTSRAIEKVCANLEDRTGVRVHPHKIRRTTATHLWKKGTPIEEIKILLGHENIATTMIYTNVNEASVKADHHKYM